MLNYGTREREITMTNKDKYLKEGVSVEELAKEFESFCEMLNKACILPTYRQEMEQFLNCEIEPTLTEDERVILRNVGKDYQRIERDDECLWVRGVDTDGFMTTCYFKCYDHLFQFIKEGEEYSIEELLDGRF